MPSDSVISLQMKLDTIVATNANGSTVELLTNPVTVEIMHWAGDSEVVAISSLPWGRYTQITANAEVTEMTFVDPSSRQWVTGAPATKYNVTMEFNPSLTVAASPVVLNLQVNPASVLNATAPVGNVNILSAQVFRIAADTLSSTGLLPETGKVERVVGLVTNVSSSALTVVDGQTGASLTFTVNSDTIFHNAPQSTLSGLIVAVRGSSNKDGSLMATEIEAFENRDGLVAEGITSGYIPDSPSVTTILQDGYGTGMKNSVVGSGVFIDPSQNPNFVVDAHDIDMTGMESLTFDSSSLVLGQHVQVQSVRGTQCCQNGNTAVLTPETIALEPQALMGKVSNYQPGNTPGTASFDLVFATDANMNVINPFFQSMHVYQQRGTELNGLTAAIGNGSAVRVWGLVFFSKMPQGNINQPAFLMVAGRITGN